MNEFTTEMEAENVRRNTVRLTPAPDPLRPSAMTETQRMATDFEYWAARCVKIKDKLSGKLVPFRLNRPQRRVLSMLEEQRRGGRPIRMIMLKARQWGGSTLVQMYMAWIQMIHAENWHSLICAHVKDTSSTIRGMYSHILSHYPAEYWTEECEPEFLSLIHI